MSATLFLEMRDRYSLEARFYPLQLSVRHRADNCSL